MKHTVDQAREILKNEQVLKTSAPVENTLRTVRNNFHGIKSWPKEFQQASPAGVVFGNLLLCYSHQKNISEGILKDVVWGFRQSGIPHNITLDGFSDLYKYGYLIFTDEVGVQHLGSFNENSWYKWTPKFFELLLESGNGSITLDNIILPKDTTVDKLEN